MYVSAPNLRATLTSQREAALRTVGHLVGVHDIETDPETRAAITAEITSALVTAERLRCRLVAIALAKI